MSFSPRPTPELPPPQQGISLDELSEAFAEAMGRGGTAQTAPVESSDAGNVEQVDASDGPGRESEPLLDAASPAEAAADDACPVSPLSILEAMLFVGNRSNEPLTARQAADLMRGVAVEEVETLIDALNERYQAGGCPYEIVSEGAGYRMALRKRYHGLRDRFYGRVREARLSQAAIDILAIVAYQQPISAEQVGALRGHECNRVLAQLVRRGLLRIERAEHKPRTPHYFTTQRFLEVFRLGGLGDLPQSEDVQ